MASKTSDGSFLFSLDGVPFAVNEKCRPPKKVTLPLKFEIGNPSEVLFLEYDSTVEETLLARFEREWEMEQLSLAAATAAAAARKLNGTSNESLLGSTSSYAPPSRHNIPSNQFRPEIATGESAAAQSQKSGHSAEAGSQVAAMQKPPSGAAAFQMVNGNILVPTPIVASAGETGFQSARNPVADFDLKDFEYELDPFENLSLKVMNDIEELDKVFLATSNSRTNLGIPSKDQSSSSEASDALSSQTQGTATGVNLTNTGAMFTIAAPQSMNFGARNALPTVTPNVATVYPVQGRVALDYMSSGNAGTTSHAWPPAASHQISQDVAPRIPDSILTGNLMNSVLQGKSSLSQKSKMGFGTLSSDRVHSSSSKEILFSDKGAVHYSRVVPGSTWPDAFSGNAYVPPPAGNLAAGPQFYPSVPAQDSKQTELSFNQYEIPHPSKLPLRSAKSNPDLTLIENCSSGGALGAFGRHTPPILDSRNRQPEQPNRVEPSATRGHFASRSSLPQFQKESVPSREVEDRLYASLSREAQNFINFITSMGFPKLQTVKAVEKLGIDEKLVLDHLCALAHLTDKGHSSKDIEKALFLFEGDPTKVEMYAKLASTFRSMGFDEEKISTALIQCSLDEEKSLDWLTS